MHVLDLLRLLGLEGKQLNREFLESAQWVFFGGFSLWFKVEGEGFSIEPSVVQRIANVCQVLIQLLDTLQVSGLDDLWGRAEEVRMRVLEELLQLCLPCGPFLKRGPKIAALVTRRKSVGVSRNQQKISSPELLSIWRPLKDHKKKLC